MKSSSVFRSLLKLASIMIISLFLIFAALYNFEEDSILLKYGSNSLTGFLNWLASVFSYRWGEIHRTGLSLMALQTNDESIGILAFLFRTLLYGFSGLFLAIIVSTLLTYFSIFRHGNMTKATSGVLSFLSGFHIIILCFIIKIVLEHSEGFHPLIIIAIALGSYMFSDIYQHQHDQFTRLANEDFMMAARAWGDSIFKHARRSIAIGLLSQWNSLVGTMFASTIIVEYFFKIRGLGYALRQYLIEPNLLFPSQKVESEFFMIVSASVIITVIILNFIKDMATVKLASTNR